MTNTNPSDTQQEEEKSKTEEEGEERLVCAHGHMVEVDSDYEEGDQCPHIEDNCKMKLRRTNVTKMDLKRKAQSVVTLSCESSDVEVDIKYTPYEYAYQVGTWKPQMDSIENLVSYLRSENPIYLDYPVKDNVEDREWASEILEALKEVGGGFNHSRTFIENKYTICLNCGEVFGSQKGMRVHKSKVHINGFL